MTIVEFYSLRKLRNCRLLYNFVLVQKAFYSTATCENPALSHKASTSGMEIGTSSLFSKNKVIFLAAVSDASVVRKRIHNISLWHNTFGTMVVTTSKLLNKLYYLSYLV